MKTVISTIFSETLTIKKKTTHCLINKYNYNDYQD